MNLSIRFMKVALREGSKRWINSWTITYSSHSGDFLPNGDTVFTVGQDIQAIGFAHIKAKKSELGGKCHFARIEFMDGKFLVSFTDTEDNLSF